MLIFVFFCSDVIVYVYVCTCMCIDSLSSYSYPYIYTCVHSFFVLYLCKYMVLCCHVHLMYPTANVCILLYSIVFGFVVVREESTNQIAAIRSAGGVTLGIVAVSVL